MAALLRVVLLGAFVGALRSLAPRRPPLRLGRAAGVDSQSSDEYVAPVIAALAPKRTVRSRVTEFCARGWIREQVARNRLVFESQTLAAATQPQHCDVEGGDESLTRGRCPDVVNWGATNVSWFGQSRDGTAKLRLTAVSAELVDLHRRVLTRGERGTLRATLSLSAADVDASFWVRRFLERVLIRVLEEVAPSEDHDDALETNAGFRAAVARGSGATLKTRDPSTPLDAAQGYAQQFAGSVLEAAQFASQPVRNLAESYWPSLKEAPAVVDSDVPEKAPRALAFTTSLEEDSRVRLDGVTADGVAFAVSFRLAAEGGGVALREPLVWLNGRTSFRPARAGGLHLPTSLVENLGSLYLSTVAVDVSSSFAILSIKREDDALRIDVVSSQTAQKTVQKAQKAATRVRLSQEQRDRQQPQLALTERITAGSGYSSLTTTKTSRSPAVTPQWPPAAWNVPVSVPVSGTGPEWRFRTLASMVAQGAAHPLRHTYVVGERLPWILNPRNAAPLAVTVAFAALSLVLRVAVISDDFVRIGSLVSALAKRAARPVGLVKALIIAQPFSAVTLYTEKVSLATARLLSLATAGLYTEHLKTRLVALKRRAPLRRWRARHGLAPPPPASSS